MVSRRFLHKGNSQEFYMTWRAIGMRWATLFAMSRRTMINCAVDTTIINTMALLMYVLLQHDTNAACLNRHLVILHAKTLPRMELITTIHGMSMSISD